MTVAYTARREMTSDNFIQCRQFFIDPLCSMSWVSVGWCSAFERQFFLETVHQSRRDEPAFARRVSKCAAVGGNRVVIAAGNPSRGPPDDLNALGDAIRFDGRHESSPDTAPISFILASGTRYTTLNRGLAPPSSSSTSGADRETGDCRKALV